MSISFLNISWFLVVGEKGEVRVGLVHMSWFQCLSNEENEPFYGTTQHNNETMIYFGIKQALFDNFMKSTICYPN